MKMSLTSSKVSMHCPAPSTTDQGLADQVDLDPSFFADPVIHAQQHATAADQMNTVDDEVLG